MSELCRFLAGQGPAFLLAATCLLALGWLGMAVQRATVHRQRAGELAIFGVLVWLALAVVPLPRISLSDYLPVTLPRATPGSAAGVDSGLRAHADVGPAGTVAPPAAMNLAAKDPSPKTSQVSETSEVSVEAQPALPGRVLALGGPGVLWARDVPGRIIGPLPTAAPQALPEPLASPAPNEPSAPRAGSQSAPVFAVRFPLPAASPGNADAREPGAPELIERSPPIDWACVVAAAYAAGSLGCVVWLALGRVVLWRVCRTASRPAAWLERLYAEVASGRRHKPRLLVSPGGGLAFTVGVWRPAIVLPEAVCRPERETMLRHLVLHELAHVRQRDSLGRLLFNLAFPFLYFHPLYWLLRSGVALAAEMIADDEAAGRAAKDSYVDALVSLARERQPRRLVALSSHGLFGSSSQFYRRMRMLLTRKTRLAACCSWRWSLVFSPLCVLVVGLVVATVGMTPAAAQSASPAAEGAAPAAKENVTPPQEKPQTSAVPAPAAPAATPAPVKKDPPTKAPSTPLGQRPNGVFVVYALPWAAPDQLDRMVKLLKQVAPVAKISAIGENRSVVVSATREDHEEILEAIGQLQALLARPATAGVTKAKQPVPTPRPGLTPRDVPAVPHSEVLALVPWSRTTGAVDMEVAAGRATGDGSQLDLISLANSYTDAVTNVKIASVEHARLQQLRKSAAVSEQEAEIAAIKLDAARRKVYLLRSIVESALKTAEAELGVLAEWHKTGQQVAGLGPIQLQVRRAEGRLEILRQILSQ